MSDRRERDLLREAAETFPDAVLYWRDERGRLVVRELSEEAIEEALGSPATQEAPSPPNDDEWPA